MNATARESKIPAWQDQGLGRGMSEFALSSGHAGRGIRLLRIAEPLRRLIRDLSDHYRPELYYMRGPGPKWREKHATPSSASTDFADLYEPR